MKSFNRVTFLVIFVLFSPTINILTAQNTTIKEEQVEMKTYPFSDPNPIANIGNIYPYFRFDGYAHTGQPQWWKMVILENDFIKVFITPEIGGKIWGAVEKSTGKAFIYYNHAVKFRNIAMRGPWTSGGIEVNFGAIGHSPTCSTPVDYILKENDDGSASCILGAMDLPSRTPWSVEVRLPKDRAYFEQRVLWHNPTVLRQSYYHWMNGAAKAAGNLQFYFPGTHYISHGGERFNWPRDERGRYLALYEQNNFGSYKSYHVLGQYTDYFGGYWHDDQFGFGHWSHYDDKPGKKLWVWGLSRQGMIWEDLLTDTDGQYIEMQSGRLFNQAAGSSSMTPFKHREFAPMATDTWSEIWFPVKDTHGMAAVSPYGVLNLVESGDYLNIYLCPLQRIEDSLIVSNGQNSVYKRYLKLNAMEVFRDSLEISKAGKITANVGDFKISYSSQDSANNNLSRPLEMPSGFDWNSAQGLAITAEEFLKQRNYKEALKKYQACLKKDPYFLDALSGMAELYYRRMEYDKALDFVLQALAIDTYHGAANFTYGVISRQLGHHADALDGFGLAAQTMEYRSAAYTQIAELYAQEDSWQRVLEYTDQALAYNIYNITAQQLLAICQRVQGNKLEALKTLEHLSEMDPLNHFCRFEKYLLSNKEETQLQFQSNIRSEFPHETYLELALFYYNLNRFDEAFQVLQLAPENPIIFYWLAYLYDATYDKMNCEKYLNQAEKLSPYLVFPFRPETSRMLHWVLQKSEHWKTKYYLGLIYLHMGRDNEARAWLVKCGDIPDYAPFYLTRAKFMSKDNLENSIHDCHRALHFDKTQWRAYTMLNDFYLQAGDNEKALQTIEQIYQQNPKDFRFGLPYAKTLYRVKDFQKCIQVLTPMQVLPYEGSNEARWLYRNAHLMNALRLLDGPELQEALKQVGNARMWPESLGAGKPYQVDERLEDFIELLIRENLGDNETAIVLLNRIKEETELFGEKSDPNRVLGILAMQKQGNKNQALTQVQKWLQNEPDDRLAQWAHAVLLGKTKTAKEIIQQLLTDSDTNVLLATLRFYGDMSKTIRP